MLLASVVIAIFVPCRWRLRRAVSACDKCPIGTCATAKIVCAKCAVAAALMSATNVKGAAVKNVCVNCVVLLSSVKHTLMASALVPKLSVPLVLAVVVSNKYVC